MGSRGYFNPERPFTLDEFRNPELAAKRYGIEEALYRYKEFVEPKYTDDGLPGFPADWAWRKFFVYRRDKAQCRRCGRRRPVVWDAHHRRHRGDGGNHALDNLELLCRTCHEEEHPDRG